MNDNPYKRLGVERSADARSVKKAYAAKVREFPPETAAEEFKLVRAAYELLSDDEARARFDRADDSYAEYGAELGARLEDSDKARSAGKSELALEILRDLAERFGTANVVHEKLGLLYLANDNPAGALSSFDLLAAREPENARHQMHRALALGRLDRLQEAQAALAQGHHLAPGDARIASLYVTLLSQRQQGAFAMSVADTALGLAAPRSASYYELQLKKMYAASIGGAPGLAQIGARLASEAADSGEADLPAYLAKEMGGMASRLYADNEPERANELLAHAAQIWPQAVAERPYPPCIEIPASAVPAGLRDWLRAQAASNSAISAGGGTVLLPCFLMILSCVAAGFALRFAAEPTTHFASAFGLRLFFVVPAFAAVGLCVWMLLRALGSPLRSGWNVHPLYLLHSTVGKLQVFSLMTLTNVGGTHHHTNGAYTHTALALTFGAGLRGRVATVTIRNKALADSFLQVVQATRRRALELLDDGCLDAEPGLDLLPPATLATLAAVRPARNWVPAATVVAGALGVGVAVHALGSANDRYDGETVRAAEAFAAGHPQALAEFRAAHPASRFAEAARLAIDLKLDEADKQVAWLKTSGHPGADGLQAALKVMRDTGVPGLHVAKPGAGVQLEASAFERAFGHGFGEAFAPYAQAQVELQVAAAPDFEARYSSAGHAFTVKAPALQIRLVTVVGGKLLHSAVIHAEPRNVVLLPVVVDGDSKQAAVSRGAFFAESQQHDLAWAVGEHFGTFAGKAAPVELNANAGSEP